MFSDCGHGRRFLDDGSIAEGFDKMEFAVEYESIPISDNSRIFLVKMLTGSPAELALDFSSTGVPFSHRVVGDIHFVSAILEEGEVFNPFGRDVLARKGDAYFSGSYGFLCRKKQSFRRSCITLDDANKIELSAFGLCPSGYHWKENPSCP